MGPMVDVVPEEAGPVPTVKVIAVVVRVGKRLVEVRKRAHFGGRSFVGGGSCEADYSGRSMASLAPVSSPATERSSSRLGSA